MKKLFFILLIANCSTCPPFRGLLIARLLSGTGNSQTQFQRTLGGTGGDYTGSIKQTSDAGFTLAGYTNSFGAGGDDFYVVKLDNNGTLEWTRIMGGPGNDIALSIIQTTDGGFAVAGETESFGAGSYDAYFMKLDYIGTIQWTRTAGGTSIDYGESIIQTADGGYAAAGYTNSFRAGDYDMNIIKIGAGGSLQWFRTIGGTGYDYALSIIQTTDGGYALFGSANSFGAGYNDFYIVKLNGGGTLKWTRTIGGPGGDYGSSIIQTSDGGYALAGSTISFGAGNHDLYVVKLDSTGGTIQWTRTVGGTNDDFGYSIIQTTDGGYAAAGETKSFGAGDYDAYIVKLDHNGMLQWTRTVGGTGVDRAYSIIQTSDGGYAAAGYTSSFGTAGLDAFIIKLDAAGNTCGNTSSTSPYAGSGGTLGNPGSTTTSPTPLFSSPSPSGSTGGSLTSLCFTGIQPISHQIPDSYKLYQNYPNPFNSSAKIRFNLPNPSEGGAQVVTLVIYDALGRELETLVNEKLNPGTYEIDWNASDYPSGVYYYKLVAGDYNETKKMILIK